MAKIKILVTNDDGVYSPGLKLLAEAAALLGDPVVLAPPQNMTGAGSAHNLSGRLVIKESTQKGLFYLEIDGRSATPVDCVRAGIAKSKPNLVLVGINDGLNLGENVLCSGTVCAAAVAAKLGTKMAIALSMHEPDWTAWTPKQIAQVLSYVCGNHRQYKQVSFNVNLPSTPPKKITTECFKWEENYPGAMPMTISRAGKIKLRVDAKLVRKLRSKITLNLISFQA